VQRVEADSVDELGWPLDVPDRKIAPQRTRLEKKEIAN
jgi:hypothetical protein